MRKLQKPLLSVILPFYNEKKSIQDLLDKYKKFTTAYNFELICVNNGSTDDSEKIFHSFSKKRNYSFIKIVTIKKNIGYGHGIMSGVKKAQADVIAWTHADMQTHPSDVFKAYEIYKKENTEKVVIKGNRIGRHPLDTFVSGCMGVLASIILKGQYYEINAQPKLFHKSLVKYLQHAPNDFLLDLYLLFTAKEHHYKIHSFRVRFYNRPHGKSKWAYSWRSRLGMIKRTIEYIFSLSR
jgi:polyisoprenyl-phosphate glycosyltransferase